MPTATWTRSTRCCIEMSKVKKLRERVAELEEARLKQYARFHAVRDELGLAPGVDLRGAAKELKARVGELEAVVKELYGEKDRLISSGLSVCCKRIRLRRRVKALEALCARAAPETPWPLRDVLAAAGRGEEIQP